jgi:hypothetical protein
MRAILDSFTVEQTSGLLLLASSGCLCVWPSEAGGFATSRPEVCSTSDCGALPSRRYAEQPILARAVWLVRSPALRDWGTTRAVS